MKTDAKKILIGSVVIAVIILFACYQFLFKPSVEEAERIENDNKLLQARVDELNGKVASRLMYNERITNSEDMIKCIFEKYGAGITPEKTIMEVVEMCQKIGCKVDNVTFSEPTILFVSEDTDENGISKNTLWTSYTNISIYSGYTQLKKVVDFINNYHDADDKPERMTIENFNVIYDQQSGKLKTTMSINLYAASDKYHTYVAPTVPEMELGSTNIFKNFEPEVEETAEGEEGTTTDNTQTNDSDSGETASEE